MYIRYDGRIIYSLKYNLKETYTSRSLDKNFEDEIT